MMGQIVHAFGTGSPRKILVKRSQLRRIGEILQLEYDFAGGFRSKLSPKFDGYKSVDLKANCFVFFFPNFQPK